MIDEMGALMRRRAIYRHGTLIVSVSHLRGGFLAVMSSYSHCTIAPLNVRVTWVYFFYNGI